MNKNCARCSKIVYPIEELKCLDKVGVLSLLMTSSIHKWRKNYPVPQCRFHKNISIEFVIVFKNRFGVWCFYTHENEKKNYRMKICLRSALIGVSAYRFIHETLLQVVRNRSRNIGLKICCMPQMYLCDGFRRAFQWNVSMYWWSIFKLKWRRIIYIYNVEHNTKLYRHLFCKMEKNAKSWQINLLSSVQMDKWI